MACKLSLALLFVILPSIYGEDYFDLALRVTPQYVDTALQQLSSLTEASQPNDVRVLRKSLLAAREVLDIFSFAYNSSWWYPGNQKAEGSSTGLLDKAGQHVMSSIHQQYTAKPLDLWFELRADLDEGYTLIGEFQDLAHSGVEFNETDVHQRRNACLQWQDFMSTNSFRFGYSGYVRHVIKHKLAHHHHTSRLFWGYQGVKPNPRLDGYGNIALMLRDSQLRQMLDNYTTVLSFPNVYIEPQHAQFHLFRKLARSIIAVLDLFPDVLAPQPNHHDGQGHDKHHDKQREKHGKAQRHSVWKLVDDAWQWVLGWLSKQKPNDELKCKPSESVVHLRMLYDKFGDLNDQVTAYQFYEERADGEQAEKARQQCDGSWKQLKAWLQQQHTDHHLICLSESLSKKL